MSRGSKYFIARPFTQKAFENFFKDEVKIHEKLGFTDTVLAENFNLADNTATMTLQCQLKAEASI